MFAVDHGLLEATLEQANGNGIANIDLTPGHPLNVGFQADAYAFIYDPVWFPTLGQGIDVAARMDAEQLLVSGYWPGWQQSPAAGMPVMVFHEDKNNPLQDTVLIGFDTTFRGHPKNTFKIVGNAIYSGLDEPLNP